MHSFVCMDDGRKNNKGTRKGTKVKIPITIYQPADQVEIIGGIGVVRVILHAAFERELYSKTSK